MELRKERTEKKRRGHQLWWKMLTFLKTKNNEEISIKHDLHTIWNRKLQNLDLLRIQDLITDQNNEI